MRRIKSREIAEYGDFQTPPDLAVAACRYLFESGLCPPGALVEPTCGRGNFIAAALDVVGVSRPAVCVEINSDYLCSTEKKLSRRTGLCYELMHANFFQLDWREVTASLPRPLVFLGNPPWVTNSALGCMESGNLPRKTNFQEFCGLAAKTGKSNFDISESMLIELSSLLHGDDGVIAMLCKTSVARKVLGYIWQEKLGCAEARMIRIDAKRHFGAATDACLLYLRFQQGQHCDSATVFESFDSTAPTCTFGWRDDAMVANIGQYDRWRPIFTSDGFRWRSGIKHDCAGVMELRCAGQRFVNGFGEVIDLESDLLHPMLKSSDLATGERDGRAELWMLVTQETIGQDTSRIEELAPQTWQYLQRHREVLGARRSSIYRNRPDFAMFGIGPYTFAPWKVCVSSLYKHIRFQAVGPKDGKPVVLDDTCYFLPMLKEEPARAVTDLLNSPAAKEVMEALIFIDSKRPLTAELLRRIDLLALARTCGVPEQMVREIEESATFFQRKLAPPPMATEHLLF